MRKTMRLMTYALVAMLMSTLAAAEGSEEAADLAGTWNGALEVGDTRLRLIFEVENADDGSLTATMDSVDQGARGIPIAQVIVTEGVARFEIKAIGAVFAGELSEDGNAIGGTWKQAGQELPLRVERSPAESGAEEEKP